MITGYIPQRLKYVQRPATNVDPNDDEDIDDTDDDDAEEKTADTLLLRETFVVDAENPKTLATATRWARDKGVTITERENSPIHSLEIVALEIRGEGGRAWKVLIDGLYYVDLRENTLLDALRAAKGGASGGQLRGPFVWAVVGSRLKLVLVGSKLHAAVIAAGERRVAAPIPSKDLEPGGIYQDKRGNKYLFLGLWDTDSFTVGEKNGVKHKVLKNHGLWVADQYGDINDFWKRNVKDPMSWYFSPWDLYPADLTEKRIVVLKTGTAKIPDDIPGTLRKMALESMLESEQSRKVMVPDLSDEARAAKLAMLRPPKAARPAIPESIMGPFKAAKVKL